MKTKIYFNEWWLRKGLVASELERRKVVSRKTVTNIKNAIAEGADYTPRATTLKRIALFCGMKVEDWYSPPPNKARAYTLRDWIDDPHALLDTNRIASPEEQKLVRSLVEMWHEKEQVKKEPAQRSKPKQRRVRRK